MAYIGFQTWAEVLAHVEAGKETYYHAPLDRNPAFTRCTVKGDKVRFTFPMSFTADSGHLDRFKRREA